MRSWTENRARWRPDWTCTSSPRGVDPASQRLHPIGCYGAAITTRKDIFVWTTEAEAASPLVCNAGSLTPTCWSVLEQAEQLPFKLTLRWELPPTASLSSSYNPSPLPSPSRSNDQGLVFDELGMRLDQQERRCLPDTFLACYVIFTTYNIDIDG